MTIPRTRKVGHYRLTFSSKITDPHFRTEYRMQFLSAKLFHNNILYLVTCLETEAPAVYTLHG